jgi:hypothetical protein
MRPLILLAIITPSARACFDTTRGGCFTAGFVDNLSSADDCQAACAFDSRHKVLCGVEQPCKNKGCSYNRHYQWTGQECQAGDEGLPAACAEFLVPPSFFF